jgi:hypothetical protein
MKQRDLRISFKQSFTINKFQNFKKEKEIEIEENSKKEKIRRLGLPLKVEKESQRQ